MIPEEKMAAVTRALQGAFGVDEFEAIRLLTKGRSGALVFRIVVAGTPYLIKVLKLRPNMAISPARQFGCMRAAAEAGLAPKVWYTCVEDGISITDFVPEVPFPAVEGLVRIPATLRKLHALTPFPGVENQFNTSCMFLMNPGPAVDGFVRTFVDAKLIPSEETEELIAAHSELAAAYARIEREMVSSHNDLYKPDNMLFDGQQAWLVDWEAACLNDRYADLAVASNLVVKCEAEERAYLWEYFGEEPGEYRRARFFLARQVSHLFYAMAYLLIGGAGKPVDLSEKAPGFDEFHRRFWAGEVELVDREPKIAFGRVHRDRLFENMRQPRFRESLRII